MVTQAQEQVKTHAEDSSQQINVQKLIDKHTKEMAVSISIATSVPIAVPLTLSFLNIHAKVLPH